VGHDGGALRDSGPESGLIRVPAALPLIPRESSALAGPSTLRFVLVSVGSLAALACQPQETSDSGFALLEGETVTEMGAVGDAAVALAARGPGRDSIRAQWAGRLRCREGSDRSAHAPRGWHIA
jgi:hypothetical protein